MGYKKTNNVETTVKAISSLVKGTTMVTVSCETEPKMNKTGNPFFGLIVKKQAMNGVVGFDYEAAVNRLAEKEGAEAREAKPRVWGVLTADRIFVEHKGNYYLRMKVQSSCGEGPKYYSKETGEEISKDLLKPWMPERKKSSTQSDLTGEVVERDIALSNVRELKIKGLTLKF